MKDAYKILGVSQGASADEIKRAYRRLARERHPDLDRDNPWAEDEFKELTAAYEVLSDPDKRGQYDRGEIDATGETTRPRRRSGFGAKAKNPFSKFRQRRQSTADIIVDGANVNYALKISFSDAANGAVKHVSMTNGRRLKVTIPAGTKDGQVLRLKGQGMPGIGGGKAGDALVEIQVEPHPMFRPEGADVHLDLPVTLQEAVLGAKITVPTIDGQVSLTIPPASNTGSILRLKGKGLRSTASASGGRGDQYVTLKVVLPSKPDAELKAFIEKWAGKNVYDVRRWMDEVS